MRRPSILLLFALLTIGLLACGGADVVYEGEWAIPGPGWAYADTASFAFEIESTSQAYDLELVIGHRDDFAYENFYLRIFTDLPNGRRTKEVINLDLAGDFGVWNGDCAGELCTLSIPILHNTKYQEAGQYGLTLQQHSRDERLESISSIGVRLLKTENKL